MPMQLEPQRTIEYNGPDVSDNPIPPSSHRARNKIAARSASPVPVPRGKMDRNSHHPGFPERTVPRAQSSLDRLQCPLGAACP